MQINSSCSSKERREYFKVSYQLLLSPFCFMKSLILSFNKTLLTVSFKHGASKGATFPPQAGDCVLEPGACGACFPRGSNKIWKRVDTSQYHMWATKQRETMT